MEGVKIVEELLSQNRFLIEQLYALPTWPNTVANLGWFVARDIAGNEQLQHPSGRSIPFTTISEKELQRISQLSTPNQVLAIVTLPSSNVFTPDFSTGWSLYLDGVQSPANVGAILRIADWFGLQQVFAGPGTADVYSSKSIQASMGTFLRLDYREQALEELISPDTPLAVLAADLAGHNVFTFTPPPAGLLVIGNEGQGIRPETRALVNDYLYIPRAANRQTESLNAAVATGIICAALLGAKL